MRKKKEDIEKIVEEVKIEENASKIEQDANVPEYYTLKIGETLKEVANRYNLKEKDLIELNGDVIGTNQIRLK